MLFTRTIRRTMVFGLALVMVMLLTLSLGGIYSLRSFRAVVDDLEGTFRDSPRRDELSAAIVRLKGPLLLHPRNDEERQSQRQLFVEQLATAREKLDDYWRKLDELPNDPEFQPLVHYSRGVLDSLSGDFTKLTKAAARLSDPVAGHQVVADLGRDVDGMELRVLELRDFGGKVHDSLEQAQSVYRTGMWLVRGSSVVVLLLFGGLVWYGHRCVYAPLRELHQGARRVAQGDFDFRIQLRTTQEEMAELADGFNSMTNRFREIKTDLDRQVREQAQQLVLSERQLVRSERLAGIGFFAAGVAHEINNPLNVISITSESLLGRLPEPRDDREREDAAISRQYLEMIQRQASRCEQIARKLLEFSRGAGEDRGRHDLTAIVREVLSLVEHMSKYGDRSIEFARTEPCDLEVNGPEIQQVVLNLVANGLEAMDAGGVLRIDIAEQADAVVLTVSDDGCGMSPDVIRNLFEPFFTQRRDGSGTGLGLSISHQIITAHHGTIDVASDGPGRGSTFRVLLPRKAAVRGAAA